MAAASFLSKEDARKAGFYSRRNQDRVEQDKARAQYQYQALHGPEARRETTKIRLDERSKRSDEEQLKIIARRQEIGVDKGNSTREVDRLKAAIDSRLAKAAKAAENAQQSKTEDKQVKRQVKSNKK